MCYNDHPLKFSKGNSGDECYNDQPLKFNKGNSGDQRREVVFVGRRGPRYETLLFRYYFMNKGKVVDF